jgi:hypothetical protein
MVSNKNIQVWTRSVWSARKYSLADISVSVFIGVYVYLTTDSQIFLLLSLQKKLSIISQATTSHTGRNPNSYCVLYSSVLHGRTLFQYVLYYFSSLRNIWKVAFLSMSVTIRPLRFLRTVSVAVDTVFRNLDPDHNLTHSFVKIHFNIILQYFPVNQRRDSTTFVRNYNLSCLYCVANKGSWISSLIHKRNRIHKPKIKIFL